MVTKVNTDISVVLVQPTTHNGVKSLFTHHKRGSEGIGHKPPLGIMILGTNLKLKGYDNVHLIDAQLDNLGPEETALQISELNPEDEDDWP